MDNETESVTPLSDQAASWWVRLHAETVTPSDQSAFGEWVARSPERVGAYLRMARLMGALKRDGVRWPDTPAEVLIREAKASPPEVLSISRGYRGEGSQRSNEDTPKQVRFLTGIAASLLIAVSAAWVFFAGPQHYRTAIGEQRSVLLADGSVITLNTASRIEVDLQEDRRLIRLLEGEALFNVAPDRSRPFDVVAGNTTLQAVGTQFNVDRRSKITTVTVVEGRVAVSSTPRGSGPGGSGQERRTTPDPLSAILSAGEQLVVTPTAIAKPKRANIAVATAWTQRQLIFEKRPLGEVAEEFNRYNRDAIEIADAGLRQQQVTGVFQANDPTSFMTFLAQIPTVKIHQMEDGRHIVTRAPP